MTKEYTTPLIPLDKGVKGNGNGALKRQATAYNLFGRFCIA